MKKILLGTTALIALGSISGQALAAEKIKLQLGGFMRQYVGLVNHDEGASTANSGTARGVDLQQYANSEIYFNGSTTLDNGLTVSVENQLESSTRDGAGTSKRKFDTTNITVSSDAMGALTIGSTQHALDAFQVRAPMAGHFDWGDFGSFSRTSKNAGTASQAYTDATGVNMDDTGGKGMKLKYISPSYSGVNAFISYAAATGVDGQVTGVTNAQTDSYSYGVAYQGEVSGASISADVIHALVNTDMDQNHFGLTVGMAGFTVGGGYNSYNDLRGATTATKANSDGNGYELGVAYETGPITASVDYSKVSLKGDTSVAGDNKDTKWMVAGTYDLGAGVALNATYFKMKADREAATTLLKKSHNVNGILAGIEIGF